MERDTSLEVTGLSRARVEGGGAKIEKRKNDDAIVYHVSGGVETGDGGKSGAIYGAAADDSAIAVGLCAAAAATGTVTANIDANGSFNNYASGAVDGNDAGARLGVHTPCRRDQNCRLKMKFQLDAVDLTRLFIGFQSGNALLTGNDPLNALSGVLVGLTSKASATNFEIMHNDGAGATVVVDTGVAANTGVNTIEINTVATGFQWIINGSEGTVLTADIPAAATPLSALFQVETNEAVAKNLKNYYFNIVNDV